MLSSVLNLNKIIKYWICSPLYKSLFRLIYLNLISTISLNLTHTSKQRYLNFSSPYPFPRPFSQVSGYLGFADYRLPNVPSDQGWGQAQVAQSRGQGGWTGHNRSRWEGTWGQNQTYPLQDSGDQPRPWNKAPPLRNTTRSPQRSKSAASHTAQQGTPTVETMCFVGTRI